MGEGVAVRRRARAAAPGPGRAPPISANLVVPAGSGSGLPSDGRRTEPDRGAAGDPGSGGSGSGPDGAGGGSLWWLVAVAALFTTSQLAFVPVSMGLGWDETVYVSQVAPQIPAEFFSAPRARGITLLVAPLAAVTDSTSALRVYLAVLSGAGLLLALCAWRRLLDTRVTALAGLLFGTLWIAEYYGPQAMPNLWIAFGGLAAVGCFLTAAGAAGPARRAPLAGLAAALALAALMRPSDAAFLALPLPVAAVLLRRRRCGPPLLAVGGGLLAGAAEWIAEAYARFGGIGERLHLSSANEGGLGLHWAVGDVLRSLDGPTLCRPCTVGWDHSPPALTAWWLLLPLLVAGGVLAARRAGRTAPALLPALCGLTVACPYLFGITYSAPRFLLPAYALLAIPAATLLARLVTGAPTRRGRALAAAALALGLAAQLGSQYLVLYRQARATTAQHADDARVAAALHRLGLTPGHCLLTGEDAEPLGYYARCSSAETTGNDADITQAALLARSTGEPTALLLYPADPVPPYATARSGPHWTRHPVPGTPGQRSYIVYLAPGRR
ncbi:hypothetical protein [Phaeacidiphilus oryzae]|uniref:hypothetical protein n=1 Tax=Phaeacidiphilus oryzae TaxID=348818 RepID=UPI000AEF4F1F|nr:hypothetical protein [Phaeacidiphilus oryzae]